MVSMRTILSVASLVMFVGVTIFLLSKEDIVPPEVTASHVALQVDPLLDTRYTSGARKRNLESFGLTDAMGARTIDRMRRIEDRHTRKIQLLLDGSADPNAVAMAMWADQPDSSTVQRYAILSRRGSGSAGCAQGLEGDGHRAAGLVTALAHIGRLYPRRALRRS